MNWKQVERRWTLTTRQGTNNCINERTAKCHQGIQHHIDFFSAQKKLWSYRESRLSTLIFFRPATVTIKETVHNSLVPDGAWSPDQIKTTTKVESKLPKLDYIKWINPANNELIIPLFVIHEGNPAVRLKIQKKLQDDQFKRDKIKFSQRSLQKKPIYGASQNWAHQQTCYCYCWFCKK